jgi:hypothetical protein
MDLPYENSHELEVPNSQWEDDLSIFSIVLLVHGIQVIRTP